MAIGNPITLTNNVATKSVTITATSEQTSFAPSGGYQVNQLAVYRNGVRLVQGKDFTANDGSNVTLTEGATSGDVVEFEIFDKFSVANAIQADEASQTITGDLTVSGTLTATLGEVEASSLSVSGVTTTASSGGITTTGGNLNVKGTVEATDAFQVRNSVGVALTANGSGIVVSGPSLAGVITARHFASQSANFTGVCTATKFDGVGTGLTGYPNVDLGNVEILHQATFDEVTIAGVSTFTADLVLVNSVNQVNSSGIISATGLDISTAGVDIDGQTDLDEVVVAGVATFSDNLNVSGGTITIGTGITVAAVAGFGTFSKGVKLGKGGLLVEGISSVTAGFDNTSDLNLDDGMVHFTSDNLAGSANTLNLTSSLGINTAMTTNEMIVVTGITSVNSTSHYVNALTIDHKTQAVAWVGGSAPSEGGEAGFDTYTFTIWKTGNAMFNVIGNHVKAS